MARKRENDELFSSNRFVENRQRFELSRLFFRQNIRVLDRQRLRLRDELTEEKSLIALYRVDC